MPSLFEDPIGTEDAWSSLLFECSYGGTRIDILSTSDENGRILATYEFPHRDGAQLEDMGAQPRITHARLVFFQVTPDDNPHERFYFFKALADQGEAQAFVHPITGTYRARVGDLTWSADAENRSEIIVDCTFHEDSEIPAEFELGAGVPSTVGIDEVDASAGLVDVSVDDYNAQQVESGARRFVPLETDLTSESVALVRTWSEIDRTDPTTLGSFSRSVYLDLVAMNNKLQALVEEWELATDLDRYPIMIALNDLNFTMRQAAQAVIDDSPRIFEIRVDAPIALLALAANTYGAADAEMRADQITRLNDIPNPARIEAGTILKAQTVDTSPRLKVAA